MPENETEQQLTWPCRHCGDEHVVDNNPCHGVFGGQVFQPISQKEIMDICYNGGVELCQAAIAKWYANKYDPGLQKQYIARWQCIKDQILILKRKFKEKWDAAGEELEKQNGGQHDA